MRLFGLLFTVVTVVTVTSAIDVQSSCLVDTQSTCGEFTSCQTKINMSCVQAEPHVLKKGGEIQLVSKGHANEAVNITETMMLVVLRKNDTMIGSTVGPSCEPFVSEFPASDNKSVVLIESSGLPCIMRPGDPVSLRTSMYMPHGEGEYELNVAVFTLHHSIACIAARILIV